MASSCNDQFDCALSIRDARVCIKIRQLKMDQFHKGVALQLGLCAQGHLPSIGFL